MLFIHYCFRICLSHNNSCDVVNLATYGMSVLSVASTKLDRRERLVRSNAALSVKSNTGNVHTNVMDSPASHSARPGIVVACLQVNKISPAVIYHIHGDKPFLGWVHIK